MQGYCNDPEQTAEVVIDEWMHTGDLAVIDEPGYHKYSWIILNLGSSCKADEIRSFVIIKSPTSKYLTTSSL